MVVSAQLELNAIRAIAAVVYVNQVAWLLTQLEAISMGVIAH
jgi:hypothetical protein